MEKLEYTDIYKLNPGDNVLFLCGKYAKDKYGGYYYPSVDYLHRTIEDFAPEMEKIGVNAFFVLNVFADIKSFDKDALVQMRDILDEEIEKMEDENDKKRSN